MCNRFEANFLHTKPLAAIYNLYANQAVLLIQAMKRKSHRVVRTDLPFSLMAIGGED